MLKFDNPYRLAEFGDVVGVHITTSKQNKAKTQLLTGRLLVEPATSPAQHLPPFRCFTLSLRRGLFFAL